MELGFVCKHSFHVLALKEWGKLDAHTKELFKKKLADVPSARLHNMEYCYKIKLRSVGYRLIYQVNNEVITVTVISVGKRDKLQAYLR